MFWKNKPTFSLFEKIDKVDIISLKVKISKECRECRINLPRIAKCPLASSCPKLKLHECTPVQVLRLLLYNPNLRKFFLSPIGTLDLLSTFSFSTLDTI